MFSKLSKLKNVHFFQQSEHSESFFKCRLLQDCCMGERVKYFLKENKLSEILAVIWWMNNFLLAVKQWHMLLHKLSQIDQQYSCSILSLFVVLSETRYDQYNYFLYYRQPIYRPIHLKLAHVTLSIKITHINIFLNVFLKNSF